jgi:hypothetical protein
VEYSQHQGRFATTNAKHCGYSTGVNEKHFENISNLLLGMLNTKYCLFSSEVIQIVMPKNLWSGSENSFKSDSFTAQCGKAAYY